MTLKATLDDIVGMLRENGFPSEASVTQGAVLPVLGDLNWDIKNIRMVEPQHRTGDGGRVDMALCHPPGNPLVIVEVKKPGGADERGVKQVIDYALQISVNYAVLTDCRTWSFYLPMEPGNFEERRVCKIDLLECSTDESADVLRCYLERDEVVSSKAIHFAFGEYERRKRLRIARDKIPSVWHDLVGKRDKSLVDFLANAVESEIQIRPDDADVVDFLTSLPRSRLEILRNGGIPPATMQTEETPSRAQYIETQSVSDRTTRPTVGAIIARCVEAGKTDEEILDEVRREIPTAKTTLPSIAVTRSNLKKTEKIPSVKRQKIGDLVAACLRAGMTNQEALDEVKAQIPTAKTTIASITVTRNTLKKKGEKIPSNWEARRNRRK